jgi:hypothetical protein
VDLGPFPFPLLREGNSGTVALTLVDKSEGIGRHLRIRNVDREKLQTA